MAVVFSFLSERLMWFLQGAAAGLGYRGNFFRFVYFAKYFMRKLKKYENNTSRFREIVTKTFVSTI